MNDNNEVTELKQKKILLSILAIVFVLSALVILFVYSGNTAEIRFVAEGEAVEAALSNNIRISEFITNPDKDNVFVHNLTEFELSGDWEYDNEHNMLTCYNVQQSSSAVITVRNADSFRVKFGSEVGSGIVNVYVNDSLLEKLDLYSDTSWTNVEKDYNIEYSEPGIIKLFGVLLLLFGIGILFILILSEIKIDRIPEKVKHINKVVISAVCIGILLDIVFLLVFTAIQNEVNEHLYLDDSVLTITAIGEKNKNAAANNIRITNIYVNNTDYDLSKVELKNGWKYDKYDSIRYMIYNYGADGRASVDIPLKNVRTVDIRFVEERGSGIVEIELDGHKIDTVDLYSDCTWQYRTQQYEANPFIRAYKSYDVLLLLFILGCILGILIKKKFNRLEILIKLAGFIVINILLAFILYIIVGYMQYEGASELLEWMCSNMNYFVEGFCIILLLEIILAAFTNRIGISFCILALITSVFITINYFKLEFRNMPFLPWDFLLAKVAATVVGKFKLTMPIEILIGVCLFIFVIIILFVLKKNINTIKLSLSSRIVIISFSTVIFIVYMSNYLLGVKVDLFDSKNFYLERGFIGAFTENMQYLKSIEEPENYSQETMESIYKKILSKISKDNNGEKPNIVVLMSESFWDIARVNELNFGEEIFPNYRELQKTSVTGELLTNVYGGGTVNSEFEALTGFSVAYLPTEYMPYQRCMRPDFFSINSYLESEGYDSLAIHPFEKTNYNRNTAYEYLGFDKTLWEEDFDENSERMRGYISDHALTEKIISEYEKHNSESDAPWFNLSVSMQNHGAYWDILIDEGKNLDMDVSAFKEESQGSIKDLAIGLHYADLALGELIDYFENVDEPTVIIMFGDHMTNAGPIGSTLLDQSSLLGESYNLSAAGKGVVGKTEHGVLEQRRVPFMAWSNYGNVQKDCGIVSVTQLLPTVFSEYNVTMPTYFEYLKNSQEVYPACASNIIVDKEGKVNFINNMTDEQKKQYDEYWLIEYDYIFGKNYLKDLFDY